MAKKNEKLNHKEELFIASLLADPKQNATKAAIAAGYSEATAAVTASKLLRKPKISAELQRRREEILSRLDLSAEKVVHALGELSHFDPRKMFNPDGTIKRITEMDDANVHALAGFEVQKLYTRMGEGEDAQKVEIGTLTKVRLLNRGENLERLGRYHQLFTEKKQIGFDSTKPMTINVNIRRVGA